MELNLKSWANSLNCEKHFTEHLT